MASACHVNPFLVFQGKKVNEDLEDNPEYVNESAYDSSWMIVIEPSDDSQLDDLLFAEDYEAFMHEYQIESVPCLYMKQDGE